MIQLKSLHIINYGSHVDSYIDFSNASMLAILGKFENNEERSNGAGKSTILDSILFALTGKAKFDKMQDIIRQKNNKYFGNVKVELELENEKDIFKIVREIKVSKKNKIEGNAKYFINDSLVSENSNVQKNINKLIVNYKIFSASYFFPEGNTDLFTSVLPSQRREYVNDIFSEKLKEYKLYIEKAKENEKEYTTNINVIETKIESLNDELKVYQGKTFKEYDLDKINKEKEEILKEKKHIEENYGKSKQDVLNKKEKLLQQIKKIENNIFDLSENTKFLKDDLFVFQTEIENLNFYFNAGKDYDFELKARDIIISQIKELELELAPLEKDLDNLKNVENSFCPICKQTIEQAYSQNLINEWIEKINILTVELTEKRKIVKGMNLHLIKIGNEKEKHKDSLKQKEILVTKIESKEKEINNRDNIIKSYKEQLETYQKELEKIPKINFNGDYESDFLYIENKLKYLERNIEQAKKEQTKKQINEENISRLENNIKDLEKEKKHLISKKILYTDTINIFATAQRKASLFFLKSIENEANKILENINSEYKIFIEEKDNKRKDIELYFFVRGSKRTYKRLSLGEKRLCDVSCRLAISNVLNSINPNKIGFICIDEIFSNLDLFNQRELSLFLKQLQKQYKQIIILDHSPYLKDYFDKILTVEFKDNFSYIKE